MAGWGSWSRRRRRTPGPCRQWPPSGSAERGRNAHAVSGLMAGDAGAAIGPERGEEGVAGGRHGSAVGQQPHLAQRIIIRGQSRQDPPTVGVPPIAGGAGEAVRPRGALSAWRCWAGTWPATLPTGAGRLLPGKRVAGPCDGRLRRREHRGREEPGAEAPQPHTAQNHRRSRARHAHSSLTSVCPCPHATAWLNAVLVCVPGS